MRAWWKRIALVLGGLLLLVLVLAALGFAYEAASRRSALSAHAPPGALVDVGGHRLHIVCAGPESTDLPTVVLESGVGGWSVQWHAVQNQVGVFARVCAYDRAGMGWSEPGPEPRDGRQIAGELHTLLTNAEVPGPYVLVGASRGGQYVRIFADMFPADTAGLVLVDAEPEDIRARSSFAQALAAQNQSTFSGMGLAARLGIFRLLGAFNPETATAGQAGGVPTLPCLPSAVSYLPSDLHAAYLAVEGQPHCFATVVAEDAASEAREAQARASASPAELPVVVLTHGAATLPPGAGTVAGAAEYERTWQELQRELAAKFPNGVLLVAENSGHDIMVDQPELVVASVRRVLRLE